MAAAYDTYDYPSYWIGRDYEHKSEVLAIRAFLSRIHKIKTILEIGTGFGRLTPSYSFRAKKIILSDPSSRLLKVAREAFPQKNFKFIHSTLENLPEKIRPGTIDLVLLIRVIHHLENPDLALKTVNRLLKSGGYLILEFPNKRHLKATIKELFKGNITFLADILKIDLRSRKSIKKNTLPFFNYHPDKIKDTLKENGFEVIETRSVSNIRSGLIKKLLSTDSLLFLEEILQKPLSYIYFGPSIFLLARKRDNSF